MTKRRTRRQRELEDGTGIEFPTIAPTEGVKIVSANEEKRSQVERGVKIMSVNKPVKGVKVVRGK